MSQWRVLRIALTCALVSGCYTYQPVARSAVAPGQEIQVQVTEAGTERVTRILGEKPRFESFRGRVEVGASSDSLYLSLSPARVGASSTRSGFRVLVPFPGDEIRELGIHRLNKGRTAVLVGVSVAAAAALVKTLFDTELGKKGTDGSGGPDEALVPLIRLWW